LLRLREDTSQRFDALAEREYEQRLATFLVRNVPGLAGTALDTNMQQSRASIAAARLYGFETERDIAIFALSAALLGPDFHATMGGAREILAMRQPAEHRATLLSYFTRELFDLLAEG
jgi:hypothetical protein